MLTAQGFGLDIWGRIIGINRGFTSPLSHQCGQWSGGCDTVSKL
ncbi:DUF2612 domain-containing protein [Xenorhabdus bovienii]|nr:DUF2612 domain-containing protein [Xenorhabdus bovienii]